MDKRKALRILIQDSMLLSEPLKEELLIRLESLTDEQVIEFGRFFALEQKKREELTDTLITTSHRVDSGDLPNEPQA